MSLQKLSSPTVFCLEIGKLEKLVLLLSPSSKPENQGSHWHKSWRLKTWEPGKLISEGRRRWTSQLQKKENSFFCHFCCDLALNGLDNACRHWGWGRVNLLTQSTESNANLFRKHPYRHTMKYFTNYLCIP